MPIEIKWILAAATLALLLGSGPVGASGRTGGLDGEGWSAVRTRHLAVLSDAGPGATGEVADRLETFLGAFARLAPALETEPPAPTTVLAFRHRESFDDHRAGDVPAGGRVLGQFLPGADGSFLILSLAEDGGPPAVEVLQHELVHHLVETNFPGAPRWLHEGLAEVYGTFGVRDGVARVGRAPDRHREVLAAGSWSLDDVLEVGRGGHSGADPAFYAVSWLLVHRLLAAGPERMEGLADLLLGLDPDAAPAQRLERALGVSLGELEDELRADLAAGRAVGRRVELGAATSATAAPEPVPPARVLWLLARLDARTGRADRAEARLQRALDVEPRSAEVHAGLAFLRELDERIDEAAILYADAGVLGPSDPWVWLARGRFLLRHRPDEVAAARADLGRVVVMEPGWIEARRLLAASHLAADGSAEEGLRVLAPARSAAPGRLDLAEIELRLRLANAEWAVARVLVAAEIAGRAPATRVAELEDLVAQQEHLAAARAAQRDGRLEEAIEELDAAISRTRDPREAERLEAGLRALQQAAGS